MNGLTSQLMVRVRIETLGAAAHVAQAVGFDLEHHRVDHQPDQGSDDQVDSGHFEVRNSLEHTGNDQSEADAGDDREGHPNGEEAFEAAQSTGASWLGRS